MLPKFSGFSQIARLRNNIVNFSILQIQAQGRQEPRGAEKISTDHRKGPRRVQIMPMQDLKNTARHRQERSEMLQISQNDDASEPFPVVL